MATMKPEIRVYQKENNLRLGRILKESLRDIYSSRFLSRQLATRDITAQYRQSLFGILWAFITPLATAMVWVVLNSSGAVQLSPTGIPYPVFVISGTLLWSIIKESIGVPMASTNAGKSIMTKINFPKEALIVAGIYKMLFNSLIKVVLIVAFVFIFGVGFHASMLLFPLALLGAIFFGITIGLLITPVGMLYKDVSKIIGLVLRFLMYATPVVYVIPESGVLKTLMELNPITSIILTGRDLLVGTEPQYLMYFFIVMAACVPVFLLALVLYRISIPVLVERMSS